MKKLSLLLLISLANLVVSDESVSRKELARGFGLESCRNTVHGRWYLTDDRGYFCERADLDTLTGCCLKGTLNSCAFCNGTEGCCSVYENCVSCCLSPMNDPKSVYLTNNRIFNHSETGHWQDEFEYCQGRCRTHQRSTVHENAYISPRHYCFIGQARPLVEEPEIQPLSPFVRVVASNLGTSCDDACVGQGLTCNPDQFHFINSCNIMRKFFECEAACEEVEDGKEQPAYVSNAAPKPNRPAACLIGKFGVESTNSDACSWRDGKMYRLCPCASVN